LPNGSNKRIPTIRSFEVSIDRKPRAETRLNNTGNIMDASMLQKGLRCLLKIIGRETKSAQKTRLVTPVRMIGVEEVA